MDTEALKHALDALFGPDDQTNVLLVKAFRQGEPLVLSEAITESTPRSLSDLYLVKLIVGPGNPGPVGAPSTSPGIGIEIWLPPAANWDGRVHNIGGLGGFDGGNHASPNHVGWFYAALTAGAEGTVSASTDSGHAATNGAWGMNPDGTPATQLWVDYAHRAMHEMAVKTKALAAAYYGRAASYAYFEGVSNGGRHGYRLAQQYPGDYDGIAAHLPAIHLMEFGIANLYRDVVVQRDLGGVPLTEGQMDLVSNAAIQACDVVGGEHLGYIMDNEACRYDPTRDPAVLCIADGGTNTTPDAVTRLQAQAINKMWYGPTTDGSVPSPADDNGVATGLHGKRRWYGFARGTSLYNAFFTKYDPRMSEILRAAAASGDSAGADMVALALQSAAIAGPRFYNASGGGEARWRDLSYAQLAEAFTIAARRDAEFADVSSVDPDLSAFRRRGGKMLSWHGWNDEAIPVQSTIQYYDKVVEAMGGLANVQSFFKLYLVPGGGHMSPHGTSNPNANPPAVAPGQFYRLLVEWVENGVEPGCVEIASPMPGPVRITQPICPYPQKVSYTGGDPFAAAGYTCG